MMNKKYIRKNKNSFAIVKSNKNYGKFQNSEDALFLRDILVENDWNLDSLKQVYESDGMFIILGIIDEKIHILEKTQNRPSQKTIDTLFKRKIRNPNNSKYGLNITKIFDTFVIKKQIAGDDYIFGFYDDLEDAEFVRNHLLDNQWDITSFSQIQFDEDANRYKVVEVIDDKVYVLGSSQNSDEIDLTKCRKDFLNKISKHKFGLASHDYLDDLTDKIDYLEEKFNLKADDDEWSFKNTQNPLNDIVFNLTPFQKSVYDAVDNSTFEDIRKSLIRFKSSNFDKKIQKNLDELTEMGLVSRNQNYYKKSQ